MLKILINAIQEQRDALKVMFYVIMENANPQDIYAKNSNALKISRFCALKVFVFMIQNCVIMRKVDAPIINHINAITVPV